MAGNIRKRKSKFEIAKARSVRNFVHDSLPKGWFQIGWSTDFESGKTYPLRYFGEDQVAFRKGDGQLVLMEAYCRHMGAHLGHGGVVVGDRVRCPFHGWEWGCDGANASIPYGDLPQMPLTMRVWPVCEVDGVVLAWDGPAGAEPEWAPGGFAPQQTESFWPLSPKTCNLWKGLGIVPQLVPENSVDGPHVRFVHGAADVPELASFTAESHVFRTFYNTTWGKGYARTWATPKGETNGHITFESRGVGLVWSQLIAFETITILVGTTPIDKDRSDQRITLWIPMERSDGSPLSEEVRDRWFAQELQQMEADIQVWENLSYRARPGFTRVELAPHRALRSWAEQFYDRGEAKTTVSAP